MQVALPPSPMGMVLPVTSTVFISRGPQFADRVCALAEADDRVFRALLRAAKYGSYLGLVSIASTISVAVMVDLGSIGPQSFIARRVVGPEIDQVIGERSGTATAAATGAGNGAVPTAVSGWGSAAAS